MLYIVATPIGNLEDITLRAISVFRSADFILAEDTRVTKVLLDGYNIKKDIVSYHQHSKIQKIEQIVSWLKRGKNLALVTDAGTPGINDPGNYLVAKALEAIPDLKIVPIPGPNAAITTLSVSGFPADRFVFLGFPPRKKGRQIFFKKIGEIEETVVFYESKHRIIKVLSELNAIAQIADRQIMIARELTKQFETIYRGTVDECKEKITRDKILGEFVIVVAPPKNNNGNIYESKKRGK